MSASNLHLAQNVTTLLCFLLYDLIPVSLPQHTCTLHDAALAHFANIVAVIRTHSSMDWPPVLIVWVMCCQELSFYCIPT